jgi:hypothetical protein
MNPVTIVTLSRYPDLFEGLQNNLNEFAQGYDRILVKDGYLIDFEKDWLTAQGPKKFVYSVNANLGLKLVGPGSDVLLLGDDVRFVCHGCVDRLQSIAYHDSSVGLLSPKIRGAADNVLLTDPPHEALVYSERYIPLVCTYIKRKVLDIIGLLDERFCEGWGYDDCDFSRRVRLAGFKLAVTPTVEVIHGVHRKGSETLIRNEKGDSQEMSRLDEVNAQIYEAKWGDRVK